MEEEFIAVCDTMIDHAKNKCGYLVLVRCPTTGHQKITGGGIAAEVQVSATGKSTRSAAEGRWTLPPDRCTVMGFIICQGCFEATYGWDLPPGSF